GCHESGDRPDARWTMSLKRELAKLRQELGGGPDARRFAAYLATLSNAELQAQVDQEVRSLRQGHHGTTPLGPSHQGRYRDMSDEQLLAETEALRQQIREKNARLGTTPPSPFFGRGMP